VTGVQTCALPIFSACSGQEALQIYTEHKENIDLVILDSELVTPAHHNTVAKMVEINPRVKMILTRGGPKEHRFLLEDLPEYSDFYIEFLQKPCNPERLSRLVRRALHA
jgi:DNA-binding NtrC family response regulator